MRQLNKTQSIILLVGACLMVAGAGLYVFGVQDVAPWLFAAGAAAFVAMQLQQTYDGRNMTVRRLRRIMITGDIFFLISAVLMIENSYHFMLPLFLKYLENGYYQYVSYVHNNWVITLLVAAVIEIYATHRISNELDKEAKKL